MTGNTYSRKLYFLNEKLTSSVQKVSLKNM